MTAELDGDRGSIVAVRAPQPWWLWPNLLSLDAPVIAVIWQSFLAAAAGIEVPAAATGVLALAVWGIYLTDRWLDVRGENHGDTDRHQFTGRHPRAIAGLALITLSTAGTIAGVGLPKPYLEVGAAVAVASMLHFAAVHLLRCCGMVFSGLKELSVGAIFAIGVAIPLIVGRSPSSDWVSGVIAFSGLCGMNCILISHWEESSAPSGWMAATAGGVALAAAIGAPRLVAIAVVASVALLTALDVLRPRVSRRGLRVLADVALLSPLVVTVLA